MVEGARLESVYRGNSIEGSNPSLSARLLLSLTDRNHQILGVRHPVHDQFDRVVNYVNQHFQPGDRIVTSDMLWYLSYVYYDRTGAQVRLYTPPAADGRSTRPNEYGFGTLVSVIGVAASATLDLPTGATVVCAFGLTLIALWIVFQATKPASGRLTPLA